MPRHVAASESRPAFELLEPRLLLDAAAPDQDAAASQAIQLFDASAALFAANDGQWADPAVRYAFQRGSAGVAFTDTGLAIRVSVPADSQTSPPPYGGGAFPGDMPAPTEYTTAALEVHFDGAAAIVPAGLEEQATHFNYFIGAQANWRSDVPTFAAVGYAGLYSGIDLEVGGDAAFLKYAFRVAPGADWREIAITYDGASAPLELDAAGDLVIHTAAGDLVDKAPVAWQDSAGHRTAVAVAYMLVDADTVAFTVAGGYDPSAPLTIDPDLAWATYLGGSDDDRGRSIAVDSVGDTYVIGETSSAGWATAGAYDTTYGSPNPNEYAQDVFVAKLNAMGSSLLYATYLGGSEDDAGCGIAVDGAGNAYITGWLSSHDLATAGAYDTAQSGRTDAFLAKLNPAGSSLLYATYLGGSGADLGLGIAVDVAGNAYVTGVTYSAGLATGGAYDTTFNGSGDVFVAKLDATGSSLLYATYLGGSSGDCGSGIALDAAGNAYVTGYTSSEGWATTGAYDTTYNGGSSYGDVFVAMLNPTGSSLLYATYWGGSSDDQGGSICVDTGGNAYVAGNTFSSGLATAGAYSTIFNAGVDNGTEDIFVAKVNATGSSLLYATYLGGSRDDRGNCIAVDAAGNALVTGYTYTSGRATADAYDTTQNGIADIFVAKLNATGSSLLYATYLGGSSNDDGYGIALDAAGNAYVCGETQSSGWATAGSYDNTYNGRGNHYGDICVAKIFFNATDSTPPCLSAVLLNDSSAESASAIEPSDDGVHTLEVAFSEPVWFNPSAISVQTYPGGTPIAPAGVTGSGTNTMTITFSACSVTDTWIEVTVFSSGVADLSGHALDGEPMPGGSGKSYIYSASADLPTGDGLAGGDAVFYVGNLRGDANGDGQVDGLDYKLWQNGYQKSGATPATGDYNGDGSVDGLDYNIWQNGYNHRLADLAALDDSASAMAEAAAESAATTAAEAAPVQALVSDPPTTGDLHSAMAPIGAAPEAAASSDLAAAVVATGTQAVPAVTVAPLVWVNSIALAPPTPSAASSASAADAALAPDGGLDLLALSAPVLLPVA